MEHKDNSLPKAIAISQKTEKKRVVKLKVATFTGVRKLKNQNKSNTNKKGLELNAERTEIERCRERSAFLVPWVCVP